MALIWLEGFEGISSSTGSGSRTNMDVFMQRTPLFTNGHGTGNSTEPMVWEGRGAEGNSITLGDDSLTDNQYIGFVPKGTLTTVITGFAIRPGFLDNADDGLILKVNDPGGEVDGHLEVYLRQGTHLSVLAGGNEIATLCSAVRINRWAYIEIKFVLDTSSGSVELRINGETVVDVSSIDTVTGNPSGGAEIGAILLFGGGGSTSDIDHNRVYDDWYVCDTTGSDNNDFLGPVKVETLFPDTAGDSTDFTPNSGTNVSRVDEVVVDDATSYNASSTATDLDLFNMDNLVLIDSDVFGVQLDVNAGATEATPMTLVPTVKSSTTEGAGDDHVIVDDTLYGTYYSVFEQDPNATAAWTVATINAMQCGYEVG